MRWPSGTERRVSSAGERLLCFVLALDYGVDMNKQRGAGKNVDFSDEGLKCRRGDRKTVFT